LAASRFLLFLPVSKVQESFDNQGNPLDQAFTRRANAYFDELLWFTEALATQKKERWH